MGRPGLLANALACCVFVVIVVVVFICWVLASPWIAFWRAFLCKASQETKKKKKSKQPKLKKIARNPAKVWFVLFVGLVLFGFGFLVRSIHNLSVSATRKMSQNPIAQNARKTLSWQYVQPLCSSWEGDHAYSFSHGVHVSTILLLPCCSHDDVASCYCEYYFYYWESPEMMV